MLHHVELKDSAGNWKPIQRKAVIS